MNQQITEQDVINARETAFVATMQTALRQNEKSASNALLHYRQQHEKRASRLLGLRQTIVSGIASIAKAQ